jgi:hypothetical protein
MRPGAWSKKGFLGATESLTEILATDNATLSELGVTPDELAETLSLLIKAPRAGLPYLASTKGITVPVEWETAAEAVRATVIGRFGSLEHADAFSAKVGGRYDIELTISLGIQECPWSKRRDSSLCGGGSSDWRIRNTVRNLELSGPELITHLIAEHGFFEGPSAPYRVDPRALTELLELGPFQETGRPE